MARGLACILLITLIACSYAATASTVSETVAKYGESESEISPLESLEAVRGYKKRYYGKKYYGRKYYGRKHYGKKYYGKKYYGRKYYKKRYHH